MTELEKDYSKVVDHCGKSFWEDISEDDRQIGREIKYLKENDPDKLAEVIGDLSGEEAKRITYNEAVWSRDKQLVDFNSPYTVTMYCAGRGFGKLVYPDEDVLTYNRGWIKMEDIKEGDQVFDEKGLPTNVMAVYQPHLDQIDKTFEVFFSDGSSVRTCGDHRWVTWTHRDRKQFRRHNPESQFPPKEWASFKGEGLRSGDKYDYGPTVKTTREILETLRIGSRGDSNHCIPVAQPLETKGYDLGVDPYLYGYWLGDGHNKLSTFTVGKEDQDEFLARVPSRYSPRLYEDERGITICVRGWITDLKTGGLEDKSTIPNQISNLSKYDRLELLKGLMDSDGYNNGKYVEFTNNRKEVIDLVFYLAASLGQKPKTTEKDFKLYGELKSKGWRVIWTPTINVFNLERKSAKFSYDTKTTQQSCQQHRMIVDIKEIDPVKGMRCITVDSPNSLWLVGKSLIPTHNTYTLSVTIKRAVENYGVKKITVLTQTSRDIRSTVVPEILERYHPDDPERPEFKGNLATMIWPNGARVLFISAESGPDAVRGTQAELVLGDEVAFYGWNEEVVTQALLTCRLGMSRAYFFTTPKATPLIQRWFRQAKDPDQDYIQIINGSTFDNKSNLSKTFIDTSVAAYKGTRLERVELYGELILENDGALWTNSLIEANKVSVDDLPDMVEISIGVDPSLAARKAGNKGRSPDNCGIIVSGMGVDDKIYVLENKTGGMSVDAWTRVVVRLYEKYSSVYKTKIIMENNAGGADLLSNAFETASKGFSKNITFQWSAESKMQRAIPYALKTEKGEIKFLDKQEMLALWDEMCSYTGEGKSPDNLDAAVFSFNGISPVRKHRTMVSEIMF